ncbi:Undecaprenyl-phosphate 4-deoxy-4-formamido-L-arabinose transferase [Acidibacillus sp. S0AB]|uniref:Undecaprenyl-phosphate 4-deoxy-4-formamido-L-arabinose transferase n=2 Tax=Sulfoacidibacillus ferrooxidans TaxID=2005001 RepID=A0A9X1V826_9BACL|nr:Undecaprenyl-phosphate 4-deoxy-4-formamido-L-arabinose transferase [Sulfoacidibacillus ferrooxidans]
MDGYDFEIIFVDDSTDHTPAVLEDLSHQYSFVKYEHRETEKGLATAVLRGFALAQGDVLAVMDADLQHPPEMLPAMMQGIEEGNADLVIPSRFIPGGDDGGLRWHRKVISAVARYIGKFALKRLRKINDPTSGYFVFRREVIENVTLKPVGWKILIEILARGNYAKVIEIPYKFQMRNAGESKMSLREQWHYIKHIFRLVFSSHEDRRFYVFLLIGLSGVALNLIIYDSLFYFGVNPVLSSALGGALPILNGFIWNDRITWKGDKNEKLLLRATKYVITSLAGVGVSVLAFILFYSVLKVDHLLAQFCGIVIATFWNYTINRLWTWRKKEAFLSDHLTT